MIELSQVGEEQNHRLAFYPRQPFETVLQLVIRQVTHRVRRSRGSRNPVRACRIHHLYTIEGSE